MFFKLKIYGEENIPKSGPAILAPNHLTLLDPPLIELILERKPFFMAKHELFKIPILKQIITILNAFPVERGGVDIKSFRRAKKILEDKNLLVVFPQGKRSKNVEEVKYGIGLLAKITKSPIIPTLLVNTDSPLKGIRVYFGKPLYPSEKTKEELTIETINIIKELQIEYNRS